MENFSAVCSLCPINEQGKCNDEKHKKYGFSFSLFTNFSYIFSEFKLDDSFKTYINTQSIIF